MDLSRAKHELGTAKRVVFLGGAGVSTASGLSDFRGQEGLTKVARDYGYTYETLLSHSFFEDDPETFYRFYFENMVNDKVRPNAAHTAIAEYEKRGHSIVVLTQNIDGLHQMAGSSTVVELHGSILRYYCTRCAKRYTLDQIPHKGIPHCECGGILKPAVTLYEEPLEQHALGMALNAVREADVLIVAGTSLRVYPAAALPEYFRGKYSLLINFEPTPMDNRFDEVIYGDVSKILPEILL